MNRAQRSSWASRISSRRSPARAASSQQLLTGVNFASAAAGIREETGQQLGARISFGAQVHNYRSAVQQLVGILGGDEGARGGAPPGAVPLHRRHGQQRLPQQLLHAGVLQHVQPVHAGAVRRGARRRVRAAAAHAVRLRRAEGGGGRRRPGRVLPQRAGAAERQRLHLRRADQRRRQAVQPAARRHRRALQHAPRRALHLHQHLRHLRGHPQVPRRPRMVIDIPETTDASFGQELVLYERLEPRSGIHRMVFVLFRQLGRGTVFAPDMHMRHNFNCRSFGRQNHLNIVAATYFNCQREAGSGGRRFRLENS